MNRQKTNGTKSSIESIADGQSRSFARKTIRFDHSARAARKTRIESDRRREDRFEIRFALSGGAL